MTRQSITKTESLEVLTAPAGFCNWADIPARVHAMLTPDTTLCGCHVPSSGQLRGVVRAIYRWETFLADSHHLCGRCRIAIRKSERVAAVALYRKLSPKKSEDR